MLMDFMQEQIKSRFAELITGGEAIVSGLPRDRGELQYWVSDRHVTSCAAWLSSSANLLRVVAPPRSHFIDEAPRLLAETHNETGIMATTVTKMLGLLKSASVEWDAGLLRTIEHIVVAETFDDFLDHAAGYHKGGMKNEAAVLASAVLEDAIKRICLKNNFTPTGKSLSPLIDELTAAHIFGGVKAKRIGAYVAIRNHALHAEWDSIDIKEVGLMIEGVRGLIEEHL